VIIFKCSKCSHEYKVADEYAGKKARCKSCENINLIPTAAKPKAEVHHPLSCGDTVAAFNNLLQELLHQEKTAPTFEFDAK
jgi:hypothetical protein